MSAGWNAPEELRPRVLVQREQPVLVLDERLELAVDPALGGGLVARARSSPRRGRGCPCARRSFRRSRTGARSPRARGGICSNRERSWPFGETSIFGRGSSRSGRRGPSGSWLGERNRSTPCTACRQAAQALRGGLDVALARSAGRAGLAGPRDRAAARRARAAGSGALPAARVLPRRRCPAARGDVIGVEREVRDAIGALGRNRVEAELAVGAPELSVARAEDRPVVQRVDDRDAAPLRDRDEVRGEVVQVLDVDDVRHLLVEDALEDRVRPRAVVRLLERGPAVVVDDLVDRAGRPARGASTSNGGRSWWASHVRIATRCPRAFISRARLNVQTSVPATWRGRNWWST